MEALLPDLEEEKKSGRKKEEAQWNRKTTPPPQCTNHTCECMCVISPPLLRLFSFSPSPSFPLLASCVLHSPLPDVGIDNFARGYKYRSTNHDTTKRKKRQQQQKTTTQQQKTTKKTQEGK